MFNEKEIKLAFDLKKQGLNWQPKKGDWYIILYEGKIPEGSNIQFYIQDYDYPEEQPPEEWKLWLPLWEQSRNWLKKYHWGMPTCVKDKDFDIIGPPGNIPTLKPIKKWNFYNLKSNGLTKYFKKNYLQAEGETDLEVIYQIMLKVLKNNKQMKEKS